MSRPPPRRSPAAISAQRVRLSGRGDEFDQLAETINDMLDRIGRLMDGVRQVSNAIAHDLRTPITRARAGWRMPPACRARPADLRAAIERATADLDGIVAVFQALLRIAEIEAGSRRSAFAAVDLAPLLADVAELYGAVAEEKGITLAARHARDAAGVRRPRADPAGGRQSGGQCGEVLPAGRHGDGCRRRRRRPGSRSRSPIRGRAFPRPIGSGRPNASFAARARATRRAPASGSRWCRRWRICTAAACAWARPAPGLIAILSLPAHEEPGPGG